MSAQITKKNLLSRSHHERHQPIMASDPSQHPPSIRQQNIKPSQPT
jgi:hypothetical protein